MQINVDLADDIAQHSDPGREALEALAIEGYRSHYQASQLLGMTRFEFDGFLKARGITTTPTQSRTLKKISRRCGRWKSKACSAVHDPGRGRYFASQLSG